MRWSKTYSVVGCHAEGEVGNVVTGGVLDVPGATMFEKKEYLEQHMDDIRGLLLFEPRGGPHVHANIILPACDPSADFGYVILESTEYPPMSGSNTICVATVALETGLVPMQEPVTELRMEAPAGLITARCTCKDGKVTQVEFTNVPAFAMHHDMAVEVEGLGTVTVDTAYGGMVYAFVDAGKLGFVVAPDEAHEMSLMGQRIKAAVNAQLEFVHPENARIRDVSGVVFEAPVRRTDVGLTSKHGVVCLHGRLDRSPTGTATSARLALLAERGVIAPGETLRNHSIIGTHFDARIVGAAQVGDYRAVITTIAGQGWVTSIGQVGLDPTDPYPRGHRVADVWF